MAAVMIGQTLLKNLFIVHREPYNTYIGACVECCLICMWAAMCLLPHPLLHKSLFVTLTVVWSSHWYQFLCRFGSNGNL